MAWLVPLLTVNIRNLDLKRFTVLFLEVGKLQIHNNKR
jgi:hypothetical protein